MPIYLPSVYIERARFGSIPVDVIRAAELHRADSVYRLCSCDYFCPPDKVAHHDPTCTWRRIVLSDCARIASGMTRGRELAKTNH